MNCAARSSFFVNCFVYCASYCLSIVFPSTQFYPHKLYRKNPCKRNIYRDFRNFIYIKFSRTYYNYNPNPPIYWLSEVFVVLPVYFIFIQAISLLDFLDY